MKIRIARRLLGASILCAATLMVSSAHAAESVWTHVAGACVIDKNSEARASVSESELRFDAAQVGEIVARCNVVNPKDDGTGPNWRTLEVVYRDPDGVVLANQVRVILKRVNNAGVNFVIATFDSNAFASGAAPVMNSVGFAHVFNFGAGAYWVEIRIKRSATAYNPSAFLVRLRA